MARRRKRRSTKAERQAMGILIVAIFILGFIAQAISSVSDTFQGSTSSEALVIIVTFGLTFGLMASPILIYKYRKNKKLKQRLSSLEISDNREHYVISNSDYKRGNPIERKYRKHFLLKLLDLFDNQCAKCNDQDNGLDLDHFVFSKNEGGNFAMLTKDGHYVNNAIPLCQSCNRSKSDVHYKEFFTGGELIEIFAKNKAATAMLNEDSEFKKAA